MIFFFYRILLPSELQQDLQLQSQKAAVAGLCKTTTSHECEVHTPMKKDHISGPFDEGCWGGL